MTGADHSPPYRRSRRSVFAAERGRCNVGRRELGRPQAEKHSESRGFGDDRGTAGGDGCNIVRNAQRFRGAGPGETEEFTLIVFLVARGKLEGAR